MKVWTPYLTSSSHSLQVWSLLSARKNGSIAENRWNVDARYAWLCLWVFGNHSGAVFCPASQPRWGLTADFDSAAFWHFAHPIFSLLLLLLSHLISFSFSRPSVSFFLRLHLFSVPFRSLPSFISTPFPPSVCLSVCLAVALRFVNLNNQTKMNKESPYLLLTTITLTKKKKNTLRGCR